MIHIHQFITRKESLDDAAFYRYWRETHGPIIQRVKQLRMYTQSRRIAYPGSISSYDGEAEGLVDSLDALAEMRQSREFAEGALADGSNFLDPTRSEFMATRDHVIVEGPTGSPLVKGIYHLKRKPGMALGDFRKYWIEVHGGLGSKLPGLRRYVQSHLIDEGYLYAEPSHDGIAQLWFDSAEAMRAAFESPQGKALAADGPKFIDTAALRYFVAQEQIVIPRR